MMKTISCLLIEGLGNVIFKGITLSELVVIMLNFVTFLEMKVVIPKKVVVVLRAYHFSLILLLHLLVGFKVSCLVFSQLIVVILVVEVV
jgi:hypothetical protein